MVFIFNNNEFNSIKSMEGYVMIEINGVPIEDLTVEKLTDVKFDIEREIEIKKEPINNLDQIDLATDWIKDERP